MPILPQGSLKQKPAKCREPREPLGSTSYSETWEHPPTEFPQTEGDGTRSTSSHAPGDLIAAFGVQEFNVMGSMAPGPSEFWMGQLPDTQLGFDAFATESTLPAGDLINACTDPFWVPETKH